MVCVEEDNQELGILGRGVAVLMMSDAKGRVAQKFDVQSPIGLAQQ